MRFLNRLPEYVLAIQHVQNRESRQCYCSLSALKRKYCSRFLSCFCSILSLDALSFQGDWISSQMRNNAKLVCGIAECAKFCCLILRNSLRFPEPNKILIVQIICSIHSLSERRAGRLARTAGDLLEARRRVALLLLT